MIGIYCTFKNRNMTDAADCEPHAGELVF